MPADENARRYWNELADEYQALTHISTTDFHYGPLLPGDRVLRLLPANVAGLRCLEVGCGAGQNSIVLARRGARCTAIDHAAAQLRHGRELARALGVEVAFVEADMQCLPDFPEPFDLVHSTFALPFAAEPDKVLKRIARLLRPGGTLLLTVGHPLFANEWIELEDDDAGMLVRHYFEPPHDVRQGEGGGFFVNSRYFPVGTWFDWLRAAGFTVERLLEPRPLPVETMSPAQIRAEVPYASAEWLAAYELLAAVPMALVFLARTAPARP